MRTRNKLNQETKVAVAKSVDPATDKILNVLVGVTGSVAAIKIAELIKKIKSMFPRPYVGKANCVNTQAQVSIKVVMTKNAMHFVSKDELKTTLEDPKLIIHDDDDEWSQWKEMGDPVLHIELRKWADVCVIAPMDANTMAKLASGICDNLLTCIVRAWDVSKPLIYCPAMNVCMYNHPLTREHLCKLQSFGYLRVDCVEKRLACGDVGMGGMAPVESIANKVVDNLIKPKSILLTLSRPILDKHPTYPIISLTGDEESTDTRSANNLLRNDLRSLSSRVLNRPQANHITIYPKPNSSSTRNSQVSRSRLSLLSRKQTRLSEEAFFENLNGIGGSRLNGRDSISGVTSIKNIQTGDAEVSEMIDDSYDEVSDLDDQEATGNDFDPSRLLEQYMTTDEPANFEPIDGSLDSPGQDLTRTSFSLQGGVSRLNGQTPLFNTSKFLALCHNKERNCFTCTICKHDYKNRKSMARHLKEQHVQGNIYECKPCGVSYKRREKLIKHNRERHPETK